MGLAESLRLYANRFHGVLLVLCCAMLWCGVQADQEVMCA